MKVLVIYATCEGQSGKIARAVALRAQALGHEVVLCDADETDSIDFDGVGAAVLAAPVHERRHPPTFEALLLAHKEDLSRTRTLMLSVSLSAAFREGLEEAREYLTEMEMRTGLAPDEEMLVAGAVHIDRYDYFATQVLRHVVLRDRPYDPTQGTHEFTDWAALEAKVDGFLA